MSLRNIVPIGFLLALFFAFTPAHARNEVLSFRIASNGGFQAVVSGESDGPGCNPEFTQPSSVEVTGASITINSPFDYSFCSIPASWHPYEVTAELGVLSGSTYEIIWMQGTWQLHGVLVPSQLLRTPAIPLPTLSLAWLALLGLLLSVLAFSFSRRSMKM
ncbi:MAG: hypothetical protein ABI451_10090 [Dokdonella sp.]